MLEQFRNHLVARRRSPHTIRLRLVYLRLLQTNAPLHEVTPQILEDIIATHDEWKPETVNAAICSWRMYYKWALRNGHAMSDPTEDLELVHVPRVVKVLADDHRVRAAVATASLIDRAMLRLGRECALRRAEIATLRITDRRGEWLHVTGKGGRVRTLHIEPDLLSDLTALEQTTDEFYFQGNSDGHVAPSTVYQRVRRLTGTPTHALRRTALTVVYRESGFNIRLAQDFAGHANPNTTMIYLDVTADDRAEAGRLAALAA